jgi:cytochrome b subunit of formate dehydrogenase
VHRTVVIALTICMLSGIALFATDVRTYVVSVPFWIKMVLIAMLLVNALIMIVTEGSLRVDLGGAATLAWARIRASSVASVLLWVSILLVSIVLSRSK